jgi:zinc transport system substrate-binding protein
MKINRKIILVAALLIIISAAILYPKTQPPQENGNLKITASFYPLGYFAEQIGGEKVQVSTLIPYNTEPHSWQPSFSDIAKTEDSNLILYLGAGLDPWMENNILKAINTENKIIQKTSSGIQLINGTDEGEDEHGGTDPHLWVCPYTAKSIAENVYNAIKEADPKNTQYYQQNWEQLQEALNSLDQKYQTELQPAQGKTFFVTHSAYGYLANRYGLEQQGLIGLSADEQPSTSKIAEIIDLMITDNSYVIYVDPIYSTEYAQTLKTELITKTGKNVEILQLYLILGPLDRLDYMEQLETNLNNLKEGLTN